MAKLYYNYDRETHDIESNKESRDAKRINDFSQIVFRSSNGTDEAFPMIQVADQVCDNIAIQFR